MHSVFRKSFVGGRSTAYELRTIHCETTLCNPEAMRGMTAHVTLDRVIIQNTNSFTDTCHGRQKIIFRL